MNTKGQDRLKRHELLTETGAGGLWATDTGSPIAIRHRDHPADRAVGSLKRFPGWERYGIRIVETDGPGCFPVECGGHGKARFEEYPAGFRRNRFLHSVSVTNGKITQQREPMNPSDRPRALGSPVPENKHEGIFT